MDTLMSKELLHEKAKYWSQQNAVIDNIGYPWLEFGCCGVDDLLK